MLHGKWQEWYEDGQVRKDIDYKDGKSHGKLMTYWDNGQLKREETNENGKLITGKCWNSEGEEIQHYNFEIMPEFPGGENALMQYLLIV